MSGELKSYLLRDVPADLWRQVKAKAALEGVTVRETLLRLLRDYVPTFPTAEADQTATHGNERQHTARLTTPKR